MNTDPQNWKAQITWANFSHTESLQLEKRKKVTYCPRCSDVLLILIDRSNTGACPSCGLKYSVVYEGERKMIDDKGNIFSASKIQEENQRKMLASFKQVIKHYAVKQTELENTLYDIETELKEVRARRMELLEAQREANRHLRATCDLITQLEAALEKVIVQVKEY